MCLVFTILAIFGKSPASENNPNLDEINWPTQMLSHRKMIGFYINKRFDQGVN